MNQAEMQQSLQRVASQFMSRCTEVGEGLLGEATAPTDRLQLWRQIVLYESSVLDIVTGPSAEANLLDLVAFAKLTRDAVEAYWIPEVFGPAGQPLVDSFEQLLDEARGVASAVLTTPQLRELDEAIAAWQDAHPEDVRTAGVRLVDFATVAGEAAGARQGRGLLHSVKSATQAADDALLLAERALFLGQRAPFLLRMHARLGAQEVVTDSLSRAGELEAFVDRAVAATTTRVDAMVRRWLLYLLGGGAALIVLFWVAYFLLGGADPG